MKPLPSHPHLHTAAPLSRFLQRLIAHPPASFDPGRLDREFTRADIRGLLARAPCADSDGLLHALRDARRTVLMHVMTRDLAGVADLAEVMATVTNLSEECVRFALHWNAQALTEQHGAPIGMTTGHEQQLYVVGMGKLGGAELNVSSDIDLVFLYAEDGASAHVPALSNQEFFERLGRKLIHALAEHTADGHGFRVDMRLRPYGDSGPLAMSFDMLEHYLHKQGREWERYAWVKARALTGPDASALMALIHPFVYRRHLDFSALASLRELHSQIRAEVSRRELHDNIKLGPGGIREIEFIAQLFQLIRGGHDAGLRLRSTLEVLRRLGERNLLPSEAVSELASAYAFLRNLEHRLQYLDDQQTHTLPAGPADRSIIAAAMRCPDEDALLAALERHRAAVTRHFEAVFAGETAVAAEPALSLLWRGAMSDEQALAHLRALDYVHPAQVWQRLQELRNSPAYRRMSASTQARVDRLVPRLLEASAKSENPDQSLERLIHVMESIGRRESYLALLLEYPLALDRLAALSAASPWAAQYLALHPVLLDELIAARGFEPPDWPALEEKLTRDIMEAQDSTERQMDLLRHFKQIQTLRLLSQDLGGALPLEKLSDHLSELADIILRQVVMLAWQGVRTRHRPDPLFAVIGYGKLGGKELGYASDLDLIFLYDDSAAEAPENYARLAQRINTWLSSLTPAGMLYETDLRLRPDGASGMLVSRLDAFEAYQRTRAWVFEHQALTRARPVAGDAAVGRAFDQLRSDILRAPRDLPRLQADVTAMRLRMLEGHPNRGRSFDIKHDRGGIVDVEFIVQFLVLGFASQHPQLTGNVGNLALLLLAGRLGLIDAELAQRVHASYREFRRLQHTLRLQGEVYARVSHETAKDLIEPVLALWAAVFGGRERAITA